MRSARRRNGDTHDAGYGDRLIGDGRVSTPVGYRTEIGDYRKLIGDYRKPIDDYRKPVDDYSRLFSDRSPQFGDCGR